MFKNDILIAVVLYVADVILNLKSAEERNPKMYVVTKSLLMPLLLAVYFLVIPVRGRNNLRQINMVMALFFHWIGDILLLFPRRKSKSFFFAGMISFFIGHIFYTLWFIRDKIGHSVSAVIIIIPFLVLLEFILYGQINDGNKKLTLVLMFYVQGLIVLAAAVISTLGGKTPVWATLISLTGVFLFMLSDFNIARRTVRKPLFGQVFTQSTYITAQTLIVGGIALMQCFSR